MFLGAISTFRVADAGALYTEVTERGLTVAASEEMPWGDRVFTVEDPDGNVLRLGSPG